MANDPSQPELDSDASAHEPQSSDSCMDCGTSLSGSYCYICGQRKQRRVASVYTLASEYVAGLLEWDSRMWRTLRPLFLKPGHLTKAYMDGKRERYTPPIRLYLISSIVFFLVVSLAPKGLLNSISDAIDAQLGESGSALEMGLDAKVDSASFRAVVRAVERSEDVELVTSDDADDEPADSDTPADSETTPAPEPDAPADSETPPQIVELDQRDVFDLDEVVQDAINTAESAAEEARAAAEEARAAAQAEQAAAVTPDITDNAADDADPINVADDGIDLEEIRVEADCQSVQEAEFSESVEFLRRPVYRFCKSVSTWRGLLTFLEELIDQLPTTMLILLPLMALVNRVLYLFSRPYYVEHLLYYVHNYSFIFLFTLVVAGLERVLGWIGLSGFLTPLAVLYVVYYFLKSMRVVYGQGRAITVIKWGIIMLFFFTLVSVVIVFFTLATAAARGL